MKPKHSFHENLARLRRQQRMTQQGLADKAGLGNTTIQQYERGLRDPALSAVLALVEALGTSLPELVGHD